MLFLISNPVIDTDQARIILVLSWMTTGDWADNFVDQAIAQGSWGTLTNFEAALNPQRSFSQS
jgi:hypothetical protein